MGIKRFLCKLGWHSFNPYNHYWNIKGAYCSRFCKHCGKWEGWQF